MQSTKYAALSAMRNKTDRTDARGIAHVLRTGWFSPVHMKSREAHGVRALLSTRKALLKKTMDLANEVRGLLKIFGISLPMTVKHGSFDGVVRSLILMDDVLVVIMGEFGRTPKLNSGQPGIPIPGRDHWGNSMSVVMAGGGLNCGQIVGATNAKGEHPVERALAPSDVLATIYHVLGIDLNTMLHDYSGRPIPILDSGKPIRELVS